MPSTTDKERRCEFCGKPLAPVYVERFVSRSDLQAAYSECEFPGGMPIICTAHRPCDCPEAKRLREAQEAAETERRKAEAKERFYSRLKASGIRKRYIEAKHPEAKDYAAKVNGGQSFYFSGSFGTGKTYLASAIARQLVYHGKRIRFVTSVDLLIELQSTYGKAEAEKDVLERYSNCDVLFLDDFGKEPPTEWALSRLYAIVNNRDADMLPLVVTSNYKISELVTRMAGCDESTAEALASRLAGMCDAVEIAGKDRRLQ